MVCFLINMFSQFIDFIDTFSENDNKLDQIKDELNTQLKDLDDIKKWEENTNKEITEIEYYMKC